MMKINKGSTKYYRNYHILLDPLTGTVMLDQRAYLPSVPCVLPLCLDPVDITSVASIVALSKIFIKAHASVA